MARIDSCSGFGLVENLVVISLMSIGVLFAMPFAGTMIRRAEGAEGRTSLTMANDLAVRRALEGAGVEFIDENGGGPGVRLRKRQAKKV